jgi:hypothetical protein
MFAYTVVLHETPMLMGLRDYPRLRREAVESWLPENAALRIFEDTVPGVREVEFVLDHGVELEAHIAAINFVLREAQIAGYELAGGKVSKLGDRGLEYLLGGLGVGAVGGSAANGEVAAIAAVVCAVGGAVYGARIEKIEPILQVRLLPEGEWQLVAVPRGGRHGPATSGLEPA